MSDVPRPNFFLFGSMKSGTTSLHRYLAGHPQIFMTVDPKEPTYFLERKQLLDVLPGVEKRGFWRSEAAYLQLFEGADRHPVIGEASANYARLNRVQGVPERVAAFSPDARILFVARDPIERTISHYWYMVQHFGERRDMLTALRDEPDYTDTSHYAMQLKAWLRHFPSERVKLITTEALSARDPQKPWPESSAGSPSTQIFRPAISAIVPMKPQMWCSRCAAAAGSMTFGIPRSGTHSARWCRQGCAARPEDFRNGRVVRKTADSGMVERYLRDRQRRETEELSALLGRSFSEWTTLESGVRAA